MIWGEVKHTPTKGKTLHTTRGKFGVVVCVWCVGLGGVFMGGKFCYLGCVDS